MQFVKIHQLTGHLMGHTSDKNLSPSLPFSHQVIAIKLSNWLQNYCHVLFGVFTACLCMPFTDFDWTLYLGLAFVTAVFFAFGAALICCARKGIRVNQHYNMTRTGKCR